MVAIDWLAVVVGTVGYQVLGAVWYGPAFGARWLAAMGVDDPDELAGDPTRGYLLTTLGALVATLAVAVLVDWTGASTWPAGLALGGLAGVGFVAATGLQAVAFEGRPWPIFLLNAGYNALALAGVGVLLAIW